jgi:hypothetical protein
MGLAHGALAVEVTGGTADIGYSTFTDDTNVSKTTFTGALEVGFTRAFSLQFDLGLYGLNAIDETARNATMHAVFHVNDTTSLGAFIGNDDISISDMNYYGVEGGFEFTGLDAEMYLASGDESGLSTTLYGLNLHHAYNDSGFGITGKLDRVNFSGGDVTRISVGVDYALSPTSVLYGEVGSLHASALGLSGSESYIGFGARINFGAARGVTFKRRGILDMIPGL